jgi:hypothetical protein
MRIVATLIAGVVTYGLVLVLLGEVFRIRDESPVYWLPFALSICAVLWVAGPWRAWSTVNRTATIVTTILLAFLVLGIDLTAVVFYSCSKGVCL